jgi:membrane-associated protease RseP (regulator of RpoE activity)
MHQSLLLVESRLPSSTNGSPRVESSSAPESRASRAKATSTDRPWLHLLLFALTLASTIYAGGLWVNRVLYYEAQGEMISVLGFAVNSLWLVDGLRYAIPLLGFLTVHEFGHYFAARYHRINTSLPYYIPFPYNGIGNFGAVIRIREPIPSTRTLFDVGAAGPLAGFVVALGVLLFAFATLPPPEYLLDLPGHEALKEHIRQYGTFPDSPPEPDPNTIIIVVGQTPLYWFLSQFFANVPPMYEMYHYPVLFAGWLGLFFTALNLLPVGQLDGGHVLYALFGHKWHARLARTFVLILLLSGGVGFMQDTQAMLYEKAHWLGHSAWLLLGAIFYGYLYRVFRADHTLIAPALLGLLGGVALAEVVGGPLTQFGYTGWLVWTLLIVFLIRVEHPPVVYQQPLTSRRRMLGYVAIAIFVLCFSIRPLSVL